MLFLCNHIFLRNVYKEGGLYKSLHLNEAAEIILTKAKKRIISPVTDGEE